MKKKFKFLLCFILIMNIFFIKNIYAKTGKLSSEKELVTIEQIEKELGENSQFKGQYITYGIDERGNYIRLSVLNYDSNQVHNFHRRSVFSGVTKIFVGGVAVGYVYSIVIDGVVIAITGHSGSHWVSEAIKRLLGKSFASTITLEEMINCDIYPPNSYQYRQCKNGN